MAVRCPYEVWNTPTVAGQRWTLRNTRQTALHRFINKRSAMRALKAYCNAWRKGESVSIVVERLGRRVPFKEPGRPQGYILRLPGEG